MKLGAGRFSSALPIFCAVSALFLAVFADQEAKILLDGLKGQKVEFDASAGSAYFKGELGVLMKRTGLRDCGPKLPFGIQNVSILLTAPDALSQNQGEVEHGQELSSAILRRFVSKPGVHVQVNYMDTSVFLQKAAQEGSVDSIEEDELNPMKIKEEILQDLDKIFKQQLVLEPVEVTKSADIPKNLFTASLMLQMDPTQFFKRKTNIQRNIVKEEHFSFDFASYYHIPFLIDKDDPAYDESGNKVHTLFIVDKLADEDSPKVKFKDIARKLVRVIPDNFVDRFSKRYQEIVDVSRRSVSVTFLGDEEQTCEVQDYLVLTPKKQEKPDHGAFVKLDTLYSNDTHVEVRVLSLGENTSGGKRIINDALFIEKSRTAFEKKKEMSYEVGVPLSSGSLDRHLEGAGLHRTVISEAHIGDEPFFEHKSGGSQGDEDSETCDILMLEVLDADKYIDSYEVADIERFYGEPRCYIYRDINIEIPTGHATTNVVFVMNEYNCSSSVTNITYPIHFRYQSPSLRPQRKFSSVHVFSPVLFTNCTFSQELELAPALEELHRWIDQRYFYLLHPDGSKNMWRPLEWRTGDDLILFTKMPLGQWTHSSIVTAVTLTTTTLSALFIFFMLVFKQ